MSPLRVGPLRVELRLVAAPAVLLLQHRVIATCVVTQLCQVPCHGDPPPPPNSVLYPPTSRHPLSAPFVGDCFHRIRVSDEAPHKAIFAKLGMRLSRGGIFLGPEPTRPLSGAHQHPLAYDARLKSQPTTTEQRG
ncbi:hypothetical protein PsYK624_156380 [Phanerochaete sordida]|uniref:Uncharacterized protein n=1 Tax=Phanerochaete sordida TaxID=48140 RepID=A0A9P3LM60_9APHY|nr:hypothetical protein PsYK624_156380 [Phanerochaete sordida]